MQFGLVGFDSVSVRFPKWHFWGKNAKKFGLAGFARFLCGGAETERKKTARQRLPWSRADNPA
jgi:hypothetical protein